MFGRPKDWRRIHTRHGRCTLSDCSARAAGYVDTELRRPCLKWIILRAQIAEPWFRTALLGLRFAPSADLQSAEPFPPHPPAVPSSALGRRPPPSLRSCSSCQKTAPAAISNLQEHQRQVVGRHRHALAQGQPLRRRCRQLQDSEIACPLQSGTDLIPP